MAIVFELPIFVVGLTRMGILTTERLRKNRRIGYFVVACVARRAAGRRPGDAFFEAIPLLILFEALDLALRAARPPLDACDGPAAPLET